MENHSRLRIRQLVSEVPGLHLRELQRLLGVSLSSTRYHVERLAKNGEIDRVSERGHSRLYPTRTAEADRVLFSTMRRQADSKILSCLLEEGRASQRQLSHLTGLAKSTVCERLSHLVDLGVVRIGREGAIASYELADPVRLRNLIHGNHRLLWKAASQFVDLWDF